MRYVAFVTKGLERVFVEELTCIDQDVRIVEFGDKRVLFDSQQPVTVLATLRTLDDLCMFVEKIEIARDLDSIVSVVRDIDFAAVRSIIAEQRLIGDSFSITTTMIGVEQFTAAQLADAVQRDIARRYAWMYTEREHSNFDIRIFIDRTVAYLSVRFAAQSLMHRHYKQLSKPGSLRPTVAAAMVAVATKFRTGLSVVDNFCGSGTILCEAAAMGHIISGGDIDTESVHITISNLKHIPTTHNSHIRVLDAVKTRWPQNSFDCAISNLPWGKQISLSSIATLFEGTIREYSRIVKERGIVCILTPRPEPLIKYARKYMQSCRVTQIPTSFTGQAPVIVLIER